MVNIEFDPRKDYSNIAKHGVSLEMARELDWDAALVWVDDRFDYGECRMIALAPGSQLLYYVAFIDIGEMQRIISLRRATRKEVQYYVQHQQTPHYPHSHAGRRCPDHAASLG